MAVKHGCFRMLLQVVGPIDIPCQYTSTDGSVSYRTDECNYSDADGWLQYASQQAAVGGLSNHGGSPCNSCTQPVAPMCHSQCCWQSSCCLYLLLIPCEQDQYGVDLSLYKHRVLLLPMYFIYNAGCPWVGLGTLGPDATGPDGSYLYGR